VTSCNSVDDDDEVLIVGLGDGSLTSSLTNPLQEMTFESFIVKQLDTNIIQDSITNNEDRCKMVIGNGNKMRKEGSTELDVSKVRDDHLNYK